MLSPLAKLTLIVVFVFTIAAPAQSTKDGQGIPPAAPWMAQLRTATSMLGKISRLKRLCRNRNC